MTTNKKFFYFWLGLVTALGLSPAIGQTASSAASSVAKVPTGMQTITLKEGVSTWFSLPLSEQPVYTGVVNGVTSTTISVASSAGFTTSFTGTATPYFVQFLSGKETGRTLLITANTSTSLTLDTTDHGIGAPVALNASGFSVAAGDQLEIFPGDTLASVFGANTPGNPLLLKGSPNEGKADQVSLWGASQQVYYFNTSAGYWELSNSSANANNTIIYPYSVMSVLRVANSNATLLVAGQVTQANACYKVVQNTNTYASSHYATPITLAQLKMGSNWLTGASGGAADDLGIWSAATGTFTFYYEKPNGNWYLCLGNSTAIQNNVTIPAGTATSIYKRSAVSGGQAFLVSAMPYSVGIN